jgi:hypothetical protein
VSFLESSQALGKWLWLGCCERWASGLGSTWSAGDMIYFTLLMVSTLWLKSVIGDGTWTILIILAFMMVLPNLFRKIQLKFQKK